MMSIAVTLRYPLLFAHLGLSAGYQHSLEGVRGLLQPESGRVLLFSVAAIAPPVWLAVSALMLALVTTVAYIASTTVRMPRLMSTISDEIRAALDEGVQNPTIYLLPLRLFIGLGWMRACAEKLLEPGWYNGASLTAFLQSHLHDGLVAFPFYETLMHQVFLPHAALLGKIIMLGQMLAGIAILTGTFTTAALLGGLFMNLNFLLAGAVSPSAFYLVIQAALLLTNSGTMIGVDWWLARYIHERRSNQRAMPAYRRRRTGRRLLLGLAAGFLALAGYALYCVSDFSPGGSVEDPAMLLMIMAIMAVMWSAIGYRRSGQT